MALHLTWFDFLGQPLSAHQDRKGIPTTVGFVDLSDLYCVVHQVVLDGDGLGFSVQRVGIIPQGVETKHLTKTKTRA